MATRKAAQGQPEVLGPEPSNGAAPDIEFEQPYVVEFTIEGVSALLFYRWNNEAVAEKASARKGSAAKKSDNVESYVARNEKDGEAWIGAPRHGRQGFGKAWSMMSRCRRWVRARGTARIVVPLCFNRWCGQDKVAKSRRS